MDSAPPSSGLFPPQGKVMAEVVRLGLHPSKGGNTQGQPVVCPQCPAGLQTLCVPVLALCLCSRTSWIGSLCLDPVCVPESRAAPGSSQCSFPRRPWSPEPGDLLGAGSRLAAPEGTSRHGPVNELSTPQIARPAWPPAGELQPQRRPADDLTAREAPNMLLLPIKSKGLWAWNHREHGVCASRGRRSREGTLLGRQKGRGSRGWGGGSPKTQLRPGPDPSEGL